MGILVHLLDPRERPEDRRRRGFVLLVEVAPIVGRHVIVGLTFHASAVQR